MFANPCWIGIIITDGDGDGVEVADVAVVAMPLTVNFVVSVVVSDIL